MLKSATACVVTLFAMASSAWGSPAVTIQARMFRRDTGVLDADLLKNATRTSKPVQVGRLDYGVLGGEMLVDVSVPDGVGDQLTVTVSQGKLNVTQSWKVTVGTAYGIATAHHPILVTLPYCGTMTIKAKIGSVAESRTIVFGCSD